jgi:hypothetical protein
MKNNKVQQSFVCHTVRSRLGRASITLPLFAFIAVFAGWLLAGTVAHAQTPVLRFSFEDAGLTTDTNTQSTPVVLTNFTKSVTLTPANLHGPAGSGVSGELDNNISLVLTDAVYVASGGSNGPGAYLVNSSDLATGLGGTVKSFTAVQWFKGSVTPPLNAFLGRMFVLGPNAVATDINAANTIGMKWQQPNQWNVSIGTGNPTATAIFPANLPINTWLFMAIVYDYTNVMIYQGTTTNYAQLISKTYAPNLTTTLGSAAGLYVGNRNTRQRAYVGWIDEFRFYTNASTLQQVESIREESAGGGPVASGIYPDGLTLQQATNKFVFTAISPGGIWGPGTNITSIQLIMNGVDVSSQLQFVTNGTAGTSTNVSVSYTGVPQNQSDTAVINLMDAKGRVGSGTVTFDTFSPTNLVVEAEEFDFNNGQSIDNADYTSYSTNTSYYGQDSSAGVDTGKILTAGVNASDYRAGAADGAKTQTPASTDTPRQRFIDLATNDATVVDHVVGNFSSSDWQNYTRKFSAGNYNVYARMAPTGGGQSTAGLTLAAVTSGQGTSSQTLTNRGTFSVTGYQGTYYWAPLKNSLGNLAVLNLSGTNTLRVTSGGGANANFYMFVPANTNVPSITGLYPSGMLFQPTNKLAFTASSAVTTINTNSITLSLNGTNVTSSLVFSGGPSTWNVSYTGLTLNTTYSAVISVTDANGGTSTTTITFDTWNPVFQVEAEDFDFTNGLYIDNPVPTTGPAANSYFGTVGTMQIDESINGGTPFGAGSSPNNYRPEDPIATTRLTTEVPRQQFVTAGAYDYNVGYLGIFFWENYTKTWPSGTYNMYVRVASAAGSPATQHVGIDQITSGLGTTNQFIKHLGVFNVPSSGGWSAYRYVPLLDEYGNYANLTMGGVATLRSTLGRALGVNYPGDAQNGGVNINFYMLVPARTDQARIDSVYPDNGTQQQHTNTLSFVASSPIYGINTTNVHVTLNGVDISSNLVFSGSSASWNVSYPGLQYNTPYTAVITVTDNNNQTHTTTVIFDTFNPNNFTWEAEDYDFDPAQSPVPNGSGLRYIDNPVPTMSPATNSYIGQEGDGGQISAPIDYSAIFGTGIPGTATHVYRPFDYVATEVTSDTLRPKYLDAQIVNTNPYIADYDVNYWATNGWLNYTRTFPTGNFYLAARLSAGNGAFDLQCTEVTNGVGTGTQMTNYLGSFKGSGTSFATWQNVYLTDAATNKVVLSFGGVKTLQFIGDYNENANYFELVPLTPLSPIITASISGTNIQLSFPTQSGFSYTIYYKNDLTDSTWTQLGSPVTGNGSVMLVTDGIGGSKRFYKLTVQ